MNQCLDEMLLITEQNNALSAIQGKCSAYRHIINMRDTQRAPMYVRIEKLSAQIYSTPKRHIFFVQSNDKEKTSKDIKEELINKVNLRTDKIKIKISDKQKVSSEVRTL